jgi:hypothetical protein
MVIEIRIYNTLQTGVVYTTDFFLSNFILFLPVEY